jgi:hypothetical protein
MDQDQQEKLKALKQQLTEDGVFSVTLVMNAEGEGLFDWAMRGDSPTFEIKDLTARLIDEINTSPTFLELRKAVRRAVITMN